MRQPLLERRHRLRIAVRLKGLPPNTQGIGARLQLSGGPVTQSQEMICGGRYLSCDQAIRVFASGRIWRKPSVLKVTWRSGELSALDVLPNRIYEVDQASAKPRPSQPAAPPVVPYFKEVSSLLNHRHVDEGLDDWARQPMLPRRLSRLGPGLAWFDWDGDGWEDLIVTGGRSGKLAVYLNQKGQGFRLAEEISPTATAQGALVGWPDGAGHRAALVALSDYGSATGQQSALLWDSFTNRPAPQPWLTGKAALGPLAVADIDGDGDLDVFVGGRFLPGRYPEAVSSAIWLNHNGQLQLNRELSVCFESIGLVSGATFCDLDGDGAPDLALAMEWGPVRVFHNDHGRFQEITARIGPGPNQRVVDEHYGRGFRRRRPWDLAGGNWGRNRSMNSTGLGRCAFIRRLERRWHPLEMIEAWRNDNRWLPVRTRSWLERGWPELKQRFPTHELFSKASLEDILGDHAQEAKSWKLPTLNRLSSSIVDRISNAFPCLVRRSSAPSFPSMSAMLTVTESKTSSSARTSLAVRRTSPATTRGAAYGCAGPGPEHSRPWIPKPLALSCSANNAARPWRTLITTGASTWRCQKTMGQLGYTPTSVPNAGCGSHFKGPRLIPTVSVRKCVCFTPTAAPVRAERFKVAPATGRKMAPSRS